MKNKNLELFTYHYDYFHETKILLERLQISFCNTVSVIYSYIILILIYAH